MSENVEEKKHSCGEGCDHDHSQDEEKPKTPAIDLGLKPSMKARGVEKRLKAVLGIGFTEIKKYLNSYISSNLEGLCENVVSVAPFNDYSKWIDDPKDIQNFVKKDILNTKNWKPRLIDSVVKDDIAMVKVVFNSIAADDGTIFKGWVYLDAEGIPLHVGASFDGKFFRESK